jgi:DNA invertase Pin-like site-specific DNA recombinase
MSTDLQKYSTLNQADAISAYAASHSLTIVRTYADEGRSGLTFDGRDALKQLIQDVQSGTADFQFILVYDVSRWGRFQDADESAYYEFICKEAGIRVLYCAESFENDGSLSSTILKNLKRVMAGEYSRELSTKVFVGHCRLAKLGFWRGSRPAYGLRRQLIDEDFAPKALLEDGQRKFLQSDRTILTPGPRSELKIIKQIFNSFVAQKKRCPQIAAELNEGNILTTLGNPWTKHGVLNVLRNEAYIGNNVFNKVSRKLGGKQISNPPNMWIRRENAFNAVIAPEIFAKAQAILAERRRKPTDRELLDGLTDLWHRKGHLSETIITADENLPSCATFIKRFGSILGAYKLVGFDAGPRHRRAENRAKIAEIVHSITCNVQDEIERLGADAVAIDENHRMLINGATTLSLVVAWSIIDGERRARWYVNRMFKDCGSQYVLLIRMDTNNSKACDYSLLRSASLFSALIKDRRLYLTNPVFTNRNKSLGTVCRMCIDGQLRD